MASRQCEFAFREFAFQGLEMIKSLLMVAPCFHIELEFRYYEFLNKSFHFRKNEIKNKIINLKRI